jgi:hypothetical protein
MEKKIYEVNYLPKFSYEFERYPISQQDKILDFTDIFEEFGLSNFQKYEGKIAQSWKNLDYFDPNYTYTKNNNLWHYHIGIPDYKEIHSKYKTSDMVLHFQWEQGSNKINLVDIYFHYKSNGTFYLPPEDYLFT